ncbi:hypothetical protein NMY22_g319 [Coprinellus aureogranulatus]|nr:hypothetical protein NMY22_g319 [Coprinellus aureogranulatus]
MTPCPATPDPSNASRRPDSNFASYIHVAQRIALSKPPLSRLTTIQVLFALAYTRFNQRRSSLSTRTLCWHGRAADPLTHKHGRVWVGLHRGSGETLGKRSRYQGQQTGWTAHLKPKISVLVGGTLLKGGVSYSLQGKAGTLQGSAPCATQMNLQNPALQNSGCNREYVLCGSSLASTTLYEVQFPRRPSFPQVLTINHTAWRLFSNNRITMLVLWHFAQCRVSSARDFESDMFSNVAYIAALLSSVVSTIVIGIPLPSFVSSQQQLQRHSIILVIRSSALRNQEHYAIRASSTSATHLSPPLPSKSGMSRLGDTAGPPMFDAHRFYHALSRIDLGNNLPNDLLTIPKSSTTHQPQKLLEPAPTPLPVLVVTPLPARFGIYVGCIPHPWTFYRPDRAFVQGAEDHQRGKLDRVGFAATAEMFTTR